MGVKFPPIFYAVVLLAAIRGMPGGAMVLCKLLVPGIVWILLGQGPTVPAVGASVCCLNIFLSVISLISPSLWEAA